MPFDMPRNDSVITSAFTFFTQTIANNPNKRVEPVNDAQRLSHDLDDPISTSYVCEFVREDNPSAVFRPGVGSCRQNDLRAEDTQRHQNRGVSAFQQPDAFANSIVARHGGGEPLP